MKENKKKLVSSDLLLAAGKSSRLAAMRNKTQASINDQKKIVTDLKPEINVLLLQARELVEKKMTFILDSYPAGKKNTFFKLKYGIRVEKIKKMAMKDLFAILKIEMKNIQQFKLIENMDLNGNFVDD